MKRAPPPTNYPQDSFGLDLIISDCVCILKVNQVLLAEYEMGFRDETILWSLSEDMGDGYRCIRMVNKITSNLDALQGDKKSGGIKDGTPVILFKWKKQENQIWKLTPACKSPFFSWRKKYWF